MAKRLLISALLVLLGAGAVLFYYWKQATQLPNWYTEQATSASPELQPSQPSQKRTAAAPSPIAASSPVVESPPAQSPVVESPAQSPAPVPREPEQAPAQAVQVELDRAEVNTLFSAALQRQTELSKLGPAVKGTNASIQDGKIESGAVVNLGEVSIEQLPDPEKAVLAKLVTTFPELGQQTVYIAIEGKPVVQNGQVQLDDNTRIKIGNLSFSPAELAQRLGVSESQIRQRINLAVQLDNLKASDVQMTGDNVVVRGVAE